MTHTIVSHHEARPGEAASSARPHLGTFRKVLVGVDGTSTGRDAIALAEALRAQQGGLVLAHVVMAPVPLYRNFHSTQAGRDSRELLEREQAAAGVAAELTGMFSDSVGHGLQQLAEDVAADLLVVGSTHRGPIGRLFRGDDTQDSLSGAGCPVAVAPLDYARQDNRIETIGVGYSGTPESETALAAARRLSHSSGAALRAMTVVWPAGAAVHRATEALPGLEWGTGQLKALERKARQRLAGLSGVEGSVKVGPPGDELLAFGDQVDLLVVGSRGRGPLRRLPHGSTSAYLARTASCPLLVLPRNCPSTEEPSALGDGGLSLQG